MRGWLRSRRANVGTRAEADAAPERLLQLEAITEIALSHLDLDELLARLLARIRELLEVDSASVLLRTGDVLIPTASSGFEEEVGVGVQIPVGEGFAGRVAAERRPILIEDVSQIEIVNPLLREKGLRSLLGVPLLARGEVIGVVHVGTTEPRSFSPDEAITLLLVADRVGLAVAQSGLYEAEREARAEAEERARAALVLDHIGDGVFLLDRFGVVRLWNPATETITGLSAASVVGRHAAHAIPGWSRIEDSVPVTTFPNPAEQHAETLPLDIGDREIWISISGVTFPEGTVYALRDMTEERGLQELQAEFVATISHELRTPLAAVYGAAMTLRQHGHVLADSDRDRLFAIVYDEADRLSRIVDDILWASRLDSDRLEFVVERFSPEAVAGAVVASAKTHAPAGIFFELTSPKVVQPVAADADKVRQVLSNLVDNAVKYSPDGGTVGLRIEPRERMLLFAVSDEGVGIPAQEQPRVFEKFYRLDPHQTRGVGGTGLGLYICRELVRRMNGRIWVNSNEGEGSTFFVELPVSGDSATAEVLAHI